MLLWALATGSAFAQAIEEIIDGSGAPGPSTLEQPWGVAVDGSGNVYVAGNLTDNVFKITPDGVITEIIDGDGAGVGEELSRPRQVAVDDAGNVYVAGHSSSNAFKITPDSVITEIIEVNGDGLGNQLTGANGIAVDGSGNVYVTGENSNNAFKITPGGVKKEIIDGLDPNISLVLPQSITVDGSGNVYVAGANSNNAFKITPDSVITEIIDAAGSPDLDVLSATWGITVDLTGNVYVTGQGSDNAFKITPGGSITRIIDATGSGGGIENGLDFPSGIAVDGSGNVYVAGFGKNNAFKITPGGVVTEIIDDAGAGSPQIGAPIIMAVDDYGNVYVTGWTSDNAYKITPIIINEVDAVQVGSDEDEFIELVANVYTSLENVLVVFHDGSSSGTAGYRTFNLDGQSFSGSEVPSTGKSFFVLGPTGLAGFTSRAYNDLYSTGWPSSDAIQDGGLNQGDGVLLAFDKNNNGSFDDGTDVIFDKLAYFGSGSGVDGGSNTNTDFKNIYGSTGSLYIQVDNNDESMGRGSDDLTIAKGLTFDYTSIHVSNLSPTPGEKNGGQSALPVELTSFTAKVLRNGGVQLDWTT
ncbi:MAG: SBBP repeat-containing protein, partial [Gramella sp.]|nr:SBBP repeat-containing protein [Christiangramia sp.]